MTTFGRFRDKVPGRSESLLTQNVLALIIAHIVVHAGFFFVFLFVPSWTILFNGPITTV